MTRQEIEDEMVRLRVRDRISCLGAFTVDALTNDIMNIIFATREEFENMDYVETNNENKYIVKIIDKNGAVWVRSMERPPSMGTQADGTFVKEIRTV